MFKKKKRKKEESSSFVGLFHVDAAGGSYNMTICSVLLVDDGESKRRFGYIFAPCRLYRQHTQEREKVNDEEEQANHGNSFLFSFDCRANIVERER
jgi:hypothetical protein